MDDNDKGKYEIHIHNILIALFLLNFVDGFTTWYIVQNGGTEMNPLVAMVMNMIGVFWAVIITRVVYAVTLVYTWDSLTRGGVWTYRTSLFALLFYISVISMNLYGIVNYLGWLG